MARLVWDKRNYEAGVDQGVFFLDGIFGEPWNGLISVQEKVEDLGVHIRYQNGMKFANRRSANSFAATIQAYTYPDSFPDDQLTTRRGKIFGFSYRVNTAKGHRTHLVYNAIAQMGTRSYTQSATTPFTFDISTHPIAIMEAKASAHLVIDTDLAPEGAVAEFESILYGDESNTSRLISPDELVDIFDVNALYKIIDNGDGTFDIEGPDEVFDWIDSTTFDLTWPTIMFVNDESYTIRSW